MNRKKELLWGLWAVAVRNSEEYYWQVYRLLYEPLEPASKQGKPKGSRN